MQRVTPPVLEGLTEERVSERESRVVLSKYLWVQALANECVGLKWACLAHR